MLAIVLGAVTLVFALGFAWALFERNRERRRGDMLNERLQETTLSLVETRERARIIEEQREQTAEYLRAQAAQSAQAVAEQLVTRATETFQAQDRLAQARLEAQLKPVAETLTKFEQQVQALETVRAAETGGLKEQIAALMQASTATRDEARRLTEALKGSAGKRGRWGEQTLRNVLEAAGMAGRFDFEEQTSGLSDEGRQMRPDVIVRLPKGGMFVIDAKTPLASFLEAQDQTDDLRREALMAAHAASVKTHMRQLAAKAYQDQFKPSPDFTAMFVPGDAFLCAALDREPDLLTEAMTRRVVIVTPTTLFALLKAVAYGWRAEEQALNAAEVAALGKELYKRLSVMGGHAAAVGRALETAVSGYNKFVGSLESQVLVQARRFEDLHVDHEGKELPALTPVESAPRALSRPELVGEEPKRLAEAG